MKRTVGRFVLSSAVLLALAGATAAAEMKVVVTREENKPASVEIKAGDEVRWVNSSGGNAHIAFAGSDGVQFSIGKGDSRVKFSKPGTYEYTVHVSGTKAHAHRGTVVVK